MTPLRYTLLADGPSDRCLLRVIDWLVNSFQNLQDCGVRPQFADPRRLPKRPPTLAERICQAISCYPCDILFVHRDAEREPMTNRVYEIADAATKAASTGLQCCVPVVPVRMTEAWLLLEIDAIRTAADNPNGRVRMSLPRVQDLEGEPDPKQLLDDLLIKASEKTGRRRDQFRREIAWHRARVAALIRDFSPLQLLPAFAAFADESRRAVDHWLKLQESL